jgi:hypothetical protein
MSQDSPPRAHWVKMDASSSGLIEAVRRADDTVS